MAPKTKTPPLGRLYKKQLLLFALFFALVGGVLLYKSFALNPNLPGDVNNDNTVNITDLSILLSNYNTNYQPADFNSDGVVNVIDMSILLSNYGKSYSGNTSTITIGETNILSSDDSGNGNMLIAQSATLSQSATIKSMSFYVANPAGKLRLGVYDSTGPSGGPGAKKAETAEVTPVSGWNTVNVLSQVTLSAGTYWLAYLPSDNNLSFKSTQDSSSSGRYYSYMYGTMPGTFSTSPVSNGYHWSFYATLTTSGGTTPAPTVSLTANPTSITSGSSSTLSWSSTNATSCTASGAWSGSKSTSGTQSVSPTSTSTYTLNCTGAGGSASANTTVTVSTGGGGSTGKLMWAPPTLTNPTTLNVTNSNASFSLDNTKDYIVKLPSTPLTVAGGLVLQGGRNIVIIGGEISHPTATNNIADEYGIALYRQTGTVHIEGVWIHGIGIGQAILIAHTDSTSANSIIQIENSRLESLHVVGTIHTDTIQSYGGPKKLRLYNNTMISNGVVIQTQPCDVGNGPTPTQWDYRKLDLVQQTPDAYGLWKNCTAWDEYHEDIYYHYDPGDVAPYGAWAEGNCWTCWNPGGSWPITGQAMNVGYRPGGYLVDSADVGIGYISPGYQ